MSLDRPESSTYVRPLDETKPQITVLYVGSADDGEPSVPDQLAAMADAVNVLRASTVPDAFDRLHAEDVGCVVSECDVGGTNGIEFLERVRREFGDLPVVLVTDDGSEAVAGEAINAGVSGYVTYEGTPDEATVETLLDRVETVVEDYRSRQRFRDSTELLFRLTEYTNDVLWMFTADWSETVIINESYETVWDRHVEDVIDDPGDFLAGIHPEDREGVREKMAVLSGGEPADLEYRIRTETDGERWVSVHAEPVFDDDGEVAYVAGFTRDISELRAREKELERSNESLQQFAYVASHDLQEPLRMVSSYVSLLEAEYADTFDEEAAEYMHYAVDGATRMQDMIDALLRYSRIRTQGDEFVEVDLETVLDETRQGLELLVDEEEATVRSGDLPRVTADRSQVGQLFQNLVKNAIEHGGPDTTVEVDATVEGDRVHLTVADDGPGIEDSQHERIFEIFKSNGEGTGIGLAMCKRIAGRHDGEIWVESEPGEGATFHVTLPSVDASPDPGIDPAPAATDGGHE